jgi:hypothetical protein
MSQSLISETIQYSLFSIILVVNLTSKSAVLITGILFSNMVAENRFYFCQTIDFEETLKKYASNCTKTRNAEKCG